MKMTKATLQNVVIDKPGPTVKSKQHICLDKGYDYPEVYELLEDYSYTIHIRLVAAEKHQDTELNTPLLKEPTRG